MHGELRRYSKRSSPRDDYIGIAGLLRQRLHLRGFPFWFLAKAFASAPRFEQRSDLLAIKQKSTDDVPSIVFATTYSRKLLNSGLSRAIFSDQQMLGSKWKSVNFLTAWKAGPKLGRSLIAFNFSKPAKKPDSVFSAGTCSTSPPETTVHLPSQTVTLSGRQPPCSNSQQPSSRPGQPNQSNPSHSDDRARAGVLLASGSRLCDSRN